MLLDRQQFIRMSSHAFVTRDKIYLFCAYFLQPSNIFCLSRKHIGKMNHIFSKSPHAVGQLNAEIVIDKEFHAAKRSSN